MSFDKVMNYFTTANTMEMLLALLIVMIIFVLARMSCNPNDSFNLKDLVSVDGKLDEKKFTRFGAWVISTWGFVYILVSDVKTLPEWYFIGYMGAWVANTIMDKYMNNKGALSKPPSGPPQWPQQER